MRSRGLRRVWSDFRRHPWLHFISVTTITVALTLLGASLVFFRNLESLAEKTNPRVTGTLYLNEGLTEDQVRELRDKVFALDLVRQVVFKDRDSVVGEIQEFLGEMPHKPMPGAEIFPDILEVELDTSARGDAVETLEKSLLAMAGVHEVDFSDGWMMQYKKLRTLGKLLGALLLLALVIGCGFIIANFMGMRHQSRQEEIHVARLMGAKRGFILAPFLWEGVIEGLLGSAASLCVLWAGTFFFSQLLAVEWGAILGLRRLVFLSPAQCVIIIAVGLCMALIGSFMVFFRFQESHTA